MMDFDSTLVTMGAELAILSAKNVASAANTRFKAIRTKKDIKEVCASYEELVNELIEDRNQAITIAQAYSKEIESYQISEEDIAYLQNTISNLLELLKSFMPNANPALMNSMERVKDLLTVDLLKSMQLLGFDYKAAIGVPLTKACANAIEARLQVTNTKSDE